MTKVDDLRWLSAATSIASRARPLSRPNPAVGAIIVKHERVIARGWTGPGGRPHAEAVALAAAGDAANGATLYVTLEPCAHKSSRGPACADLVATSGLARVVIGCLDPDRRTAGKGIERIRTAGIVADCIPCSEAEASLAGYLTQRRQQRPFVTLKLALSQDGCLARQPGESRWLTGEAARAHCHAIRAKNDAILVGGTTYRIDKPRLDVRLPGLETRSPQRWLLTRDAVPQGWSAISSPEAIGDIAEAQYLFVEGGAACARAFISAGLVDRLMIYRAPITVGPGVLALSDFTLDALSSSYKKWRQIDQRVLGTDTLEVYEALCLQE